MSKNAILFKDVTNTKDAKNALRVVIVGDSTPDPDPTPPPTYNRSLNLYNFMDPGHKFSIEFHGRCNSIYEYNSNNPVFPKDFRYFSDTYTDVHFSFPNPYYIESTDFPRLYNGSDPSLVDPDQSRMLNATWGPYTPDNGYRNTGLNLAPPMVTLNANRVLDTYPWWNFSGQLLIEPLPQNLVWFDTGASSDTSNELNTFYFPAAMPALSENTQDNPRLPYYMQTIYTGYVKLKLISPSENKILSIPYNYDKN